MQEPPYLSTKVVKVIGGRDSDELRSLPLLCDWFKQDSGLVATNSPGWSATYVNYVDGLSQVLQSGYPGGQHQR